MKKLEQIYKEIAERHGTSPEKVRRDIRGALNAGARNPDLEIRNVWESIPHSGDRPTPKEMIAFCADECRQRLQQENPENTNKR